MEKKGMRILQINVTYKYGSTGKIVDSIHQKLLSLGHDSHVLYGRHEQEELMNTHYMGNKVSHFLHGLKTRIFDRHGFGSLYTTKKYLSNLNLESFDVVHLHNIHGYYIHIGYLLKALKKANVQVVWTLHDTWPYTGHCFGYQHVGCKKWKTSCHHCPLKNEYPSSLFLDRSKKNHEDKKRLIGNLTNIHFVCSSNFLSREIKESFLNQFPSTTIHNGINLNDFSIKPSKIEKFQILGVANIWNHTKGLEVFSSLREKLDDSFEIVVVGKIPKHMIRHEKIRYIDQTKDKHELIRLYQSSACLVNPTVEDNFPTVSIEALACGTPVVTYDTGGSNEIVDASNGYICKPNNIDCLIQSILEIKAKGKSYFSSSCLNKSKQFDEHQMTLNYIKKYQEVIHS
jgi:putative colanic acid biosynthesis glycosyltransferase